jgi:hypothetical protein
MSTPSPGSSIRCPMVEATPATSTRKHLGLALDGALPAHTSWVATSPSGKRLLPAGRPDLGLRFSSDDSMTPEPETTRPNEHARGIDLGGRRQKPPP